MKKLIFLGYTTDHRWLGQRRAATGVLEKQRNQGQNPAPSSPQCSPSSLSQPSPSRSPSKRSRASSSPTNGSAANDVIKPIYTLRNFPPGVETSPDFPLLYRRFPVSSYWEVQSSDPNHPGGTYNTPRWPLDLYTPRFVKGRGTEKVGMCPVCIEPVERGGIGKAIWLVMKFSAFNYHMQYTHGISAITGRPFSPPIAFRRVDIQSKGRKEKCQVQEGKCHKCENWIQVEGVKEKGIKIKEIFWWKHAASCHKNSVIQEDDEYYEKDQFYERLKDIE